MSKRKLKQYKGPLNSEQIAAGINAANENSIRLLEDAIILLESGRLPSATALAILAIEEAGKASILRGLAVAKTLEEINQYWREYRTHTKKNVAWLLPSLVLQGARTLDDLRPLFDNSSEHPFILDQVKQIAFYTDCLGNAHWSIPNNVIDESLAKIIIQTAKILCQKSRFISPEEIELWIKHLRPVWKTSLERMKKAIVNWYKECKERGLISDDEEIDFYEFIYGADCT
ncbi:MAG: AbiV family abortive infection protein [Thermoanaerobacteraceae bacterium]|nr:AbiV family abortive infection protein [Thermoanaerobacteraceae bacterium]